MTKRVFVLTGGKGAGKSTAAARFVPPDRAAMAGACVVDTEDSMSDILRQNQELGFEFGSYIRAYERFHDDDMLDRMAQGNLPWVTDKQRGALCEYYEWFIYTLDKTLKRGTFRTLIIDTVEPIEAAMTAWAEKNRDKSGWSGTKAYGRLETEAVRPLYENMLEAIAQRGVTDILLTSHLKRIWENDRPILNKVQPGGRLIVLSRLSTAMFWLTQNSQNEDGAPAGIVLKARMGKTVIEDGRWVTRRVLPERIPHFTWADVERYVISPANIAHPAEGEKMTPDERAMISEMLTDEQMRLMVLGAEQDLERVKAETSEVRVIQFAQPEPDKMSNAEIIKAALAGGKSAAEVATEFDMPLPEVLRIARS